MCAKSSTDPGRMIIVSFLMTVDPETLFPGEVFWRIKKPGSQIRVADRNCGHRCDGSRNPIRSLLHPWRLQFGSLLPRVACQCLGRGRLHQQLTYPCAPASVAATGCF